MRLPSFARTVRFRLTIWYSSLLLVFGIAFVVALNLAARLDQPQFVLDDAQINLHFTVERDGPGQAITGILPTGITLKEAEDAIHSENLDRLRTWSLLAVVGLALASGVGGYVLSGMMLQPVRDITRVASEIGATNLHRRINHEGPDDELKALADTFDSMIGRLEESFEQQRQFVQDASHELRTPLAAIRTNIEVTELDGDASVDEYRSVLETVKAQTERLTRLSEDLLLLTTSDREPELEPVAAVALAREVARELVSLAAARGVMVAVEGDADIETVANGDLLYRCVFNLVDNAIKYSGEGAAVTVRIARDAGRVRIGVTDTGPGMEPEQAAHVFERFYRVDKGRSRRDGGTGLGLAIVKELVHTMGGTVGLETAPGKGSTFTITLREEEPEAEPARGEQLAYA